MDGRVTASALSRLEAAGVPVVTTLIMKEQLRKHPTQISSILDVEKPHWEVAFGQRETANGSLPPITWRSLFDVLRGLNLEKLSQEIRIYLSSKYDIAGLFVG